MRKTLQEVQECVHFSKVKDEELSPRRTGQVATQQLLLLPRSHDPTRPGLPQATKKCHVKNEGFHVHQTSAGAPDPSNPLDKIHDSERSTVERTRLANETEVPSPKATRR